MLLTEAQVDYRKTFLRRHIERELRRTDDPQSRQTDGVLALEELNSRFEELGCRNDPEVRGRINRVEFFCNENRDERLYVPVRIYNVAKPREENYEDLTDLLDQTRHEAFGILIQAASGAGKSVACLRAFYASLPHKRRVGDHELVTLPILNGYAPCWVRFGDWLPPDPWEALISLIGWAADPGRQADDPEGHHNQILQYLKWGPPLLIFFDLNTADWKTRTSVADTLVRFQRRFASQGHRCIVTYRSTDDEDEVLQTLRESGTSTFRAYDLQPIPYLEGRRYLRRVRNVEAAVRKRLIDNGRKDVKSFSPSDIDDDCKTFGDLLMRHARGTNSLISTPLLMHFVASLPQGEVQTVRTLWDLYGRVVDMHIKREKKYVDAMPDWLKNARNRRKWVLAWMVRIAWAMLSQGVQKTRLDEDTAEDLLFKPANVLPPDQQTGGLWHNSEYLKLCPPAEVGEGDPFGDLLKFSLLRRDSQTGDIAFLHDSFVSYMAAYGARYHKGLGRPKALDGLSDQWFEGVAHLLGRRQDPWRDVCEFLAGGLTETRSQAPYQTSVVTKTLGSQQNSALSDDVDFSGVHRLAIEVILLEQANDMPSVVGRLLRGAKSEDDTVCRGLSEALCWHKSLTSQNPLQLAQDCYNHLYWRNAGSGGGTNPCLRFATLLRRKLCQRNHTWLRQRNGPSIFSVLTMSEHQDQINSLVVLGDGRVASCSSDGKVKVWDPFTGEVITMPHHSDWVLTLAALPDGRIVSGGTDSAVMVWDSIADPDALDVKSMRAHTDHITAVRILTDGRTIVSGSRDATIKAWDIDDDPDSQAVQTLVKCAGPVLSLDLLFDGRLAFVEDVMDPRVRFSKRDACVRVLDPKNPRAGVRDVLQNEFPCTIVGDRSGRVAVNHSPSPVVLLPHAVLSADSCRNCFLEIWNPDTNEFSTSVRVRADVTTMTAFDGGKGDLVTGTDNKITIWDRQTGEAKADVDFVREPRLLLALPDNRIAWTEHLDCFLGTYGPIRLWNPAGKKIQALNEHTHTVTSLVSHPLGFVSASEDSTVKLWQPDRLTTESAEYRPHSLAVSPEGSVVMGVRGGILSWSSIPPHATVHEMIRQHVGHVNSVLALDDHRIVSCGDDGTAMLWDSVERTSETVIEHYAPVLSLAVDDEFLVSGDKDGQVRRRSLRGGSVAVMREHAGPVTALAVLQSGWIVSGSNFYDSCVKAWHPERKTVKTLLAHKKPVCSLAPLSSDKVVSGGMDGRMIVWEPGTGEWRRVYESNSPIAAVALVATGIVVFAEDKALRMWNVEDDSVRDVVRHDTSIGGVEILPGGWAASIDDNGIVNVSHPTAEPSEDVVLTFHLGVGRYCIAAHPTRPRLVIGTSVSTSNCRGIMYVLDVESAAQNHRHVTA